VDKDWTKYAREILGITGEDTPMNRLLENKVPAVALACALAYGDGRAAEKAEIRDWIDGKIQRHNPPSAE
jgi:hypothetical protein